MTSIKAFILLLFLCICAAGMHGQDEQLDMEVNATGNDRFVLRAANTNTSGFSALATRFQSGDGSNIGEGNITVFARNYNALPSYGGFFDLDGLDSGVNVRASNPTGVIRFMTGGTNVFSHTRMTVDHLGNVGIGTQAPVSKLQVGGGSIYVSDLGSDVILRSSNGSCWSVSVSNAGSLTTASIPCP